MSYQTSSKRSPPFWLLIGARKKHKFSGTNQKPERRRPFGTGLVRHCPQGLFSPFFTFLRAIYFSARLDFSSSPLSAPGSPRMCVIQNPKPPVCNPESKIVLNSITLGDADGGGCYRHYRYTHSENCIILHIIRKPNPIIISFISLKQLRIKEVLTSIYSHLPFPRQFQIITS